MPASIPPGLRVRCARARIRPGMESEAERWMRMLNDRRAEAEETLARARVALEIVFREGEWLVWVMVQGEGGAGSDDSPFDIDRDHRALAERVKEPSRPEASPELLLMPEPVRAAVLGWALS
jgi:hypothetical protein